MKCKTRLHIEINKIILNFYFSDIPYLRELHLNRNPLQKIEANAFVMVPDLVSLDLSHSNIKRVAAKAFSQLDSLEKLYINHNEIRELKRATVETFKGNNMMDKYLDFQKKNTYIYRKNINKMIILCSRFTWYRTSAQSVEL